MTMAKLNKIPLVGAVIGLGVGEQHALAVHDEERAKLKYVFDTNPEKAKSVADKTGNPAIAESYEAILADPEVDFICLATFDHDHYDHVLMGLAAGKHIFVEKPLCRINTEIDSIYQAWEKAGRPVIASNLPLRAAPLYQWLQQEISKGTFGTVYAFDGDYLYGRLNKITHGWRKDVENYSVMEGGGIHLIDLMTGLTGQKPASVQTIGTNIATENTDFKYDDFMAATFSFENGMIGRISANFGCTHPHQHSMRIFGTKATFIMDDEGPRLQTARDPYENDVYDGAPKPTPPAQKLNLAEKPPHKGALIPKFIDLILQGDCDSTVHSEFDLIRICAASDESHKKGDKVNIKYTQQKDEQHHERDSIRAPLD